MLFPGKPHRGRLGRSSGSSRHRKMKTHSTHRPVAGEFPGADAPSAMPKPLAKLLALICVMFAPLSGCTTTETPLFEADQVPYSSAKLREGNILAVSFPG